MKKIIGIILIVLFFLALWVGLSIVFYNGGVSLLWSIILPLCIYLSVVLINGFCELVAWLLK